MIHEQPAGPLPSRPIGAVMRARRSALARTLGEVANAAGCSRSYLSQIENGRVAPPAEPLLARLELALGLAPGELARPARARRSPRGAGAALRDDLARIESALARLTRWLVEPATDEDGPGIPIIADGGAPAGSAGERVRVPGLCDPRAFAVRLRGEVATPMYRAGDVIIFSPARAAVSGSDCYVRLSPDDSAATQRDEPEAMEAPGRSDPGPGVFARVHFDDPGLVRIEPLAGGPGPRLIARRKIAGLHPAITIIRPIG